MNRSINRLIDGSIDRWLVRSSNRLIKQFHRQRNHNDETTQNWTPNKQYIKNWLSKIKTKKKNNSRKEQRVRNIDIINRRCPWKTWTLHGRCPVVFQNLDFWMGGVGFCFYKILKSNNTVKKIKNRCGLRCPLAWSYMVHIWSCERTPQDTPVSYDFYSVFWFQYFSKNQTPLIQKSRFWKNTANLHAIFMFSHS